MKLRLKLILRTVALAALVFGAFGSILIQSSFQMQFSREQNALEERSARLIQSLEAAAVNYALQNIPLTDDLIAGILSQMDSSAVCRPAEESPAETHMYLSETSLCALRPALLNGKTRYILITADLSALYQARRSLLSVYAGLYLIILAAFSALMAITSKLLVRPIEQLAQVSARLASGETAVRAQPDDTQETAQLALAFNQMTDSLTGQIERQNRFIADLTHEMKTPLTAIIGHADLIRSNRISGDEIPLAAHSILKEGQRLNSLSARLTDLILLNQDEIALQPVHASVLIHEAADALRPAAEERKIILTASCTDAVISCDPPLMRSLISNLIDNALKSGADRISVTGEQESGVFTLRVTDNGRGMPREALDKITSPFYRVDKSRSRTQGGAGLGLALCAEIARLHRAILSFESSPGDGTTVSLSMLGKEAPFHEEE